MIVKKALKITLGVRGHWELKNNSRIVEWTVIKWVAGSHSGPSVLCGCLCLAPRGPPSLPMDPSPTRGPCPSWQDPSPTKQFSASPAPWVPDDHLQNLLVAVKKDSLFDDGPTRLLLVSLWVSHHGRRYRGCDDISHSRWKSGSTSFVNQFSNFRKLAYSLGRMVRFLYYCLPVVDKIGITVFHT